MEKDLKILEEFIKYYEAEATSRKFRGTLSISVDEDDIEAIENLIKGYRELEEGYDKLAKHFVENHIPKSKIKEKIEEHKQITDKYDKQMENEEETDLSYEEVREYACRLQVLQDLLEDK